MMHVFPTRQAALSAATIRIELALHRRLLSDERAAIVVSGGSTPGPIYSNLAHRQLDWHRVDVVLSDERWTPPDSADSNERMLRERLITSRGTYGTLLPFYDASSTPDDRAATLNGIIEELSLPFACTLLGMGEDGHFASLFPNAENLSAGLDMDGTELCLPIETSASPHPRLSLTLNALTRSDEILLLFFGDEKRAVYEQAKAGLCELPIYHLLSQQRAPVDVYWAA